MLLPSEPVSQYRCMNLPITDDSDRAHKNDANALDIWSILLPGQVPLGATQVTCFGISKTLR